MKSGFAWRPWSRQNVLDLETITEMEDYLDDTLIPVKPSPTFISGLRDRLLVAPEQQLASMPPALQYTLLGVLGVFSGIIILVTGVRAMVTLWGAIGILSHLLKRSAPA